MKKSKPASSGRKIVEPENDRSHRQFLKASGLSTPKIYEAIAKNLPVGFSLVDQDGLIVDFNPAAERLTGHLKSDIQGKPHLEILHGSSDPKSCPTMERSRWKAYPERAAPSGSLFQKKILLFPAVRSTQDGQISI
jgi:PAS domain-containing protein